MQDALRLSHVNIVLGWPSQCGCMRRLSQTADLQIYVKFEGLKFSCYHVG